MSPNALPSSNRHPDVTQGFAYSAVDISIAGSWDYLGRQLRAFRSWDAKISLKFPSFPQEKLEAAMRVNLQGTPISTVLIINHNCSKMLTGSCRSHKSDIFTLRIDSAAR